MQQTVIYTCKLYAPYLTQQFQETICRKFCNLRNLENIMVIQEVEGKKNLERILDDAANYKRIVVFSLACLGNDLSDILHFIKKIVDHSSLVSVMDPVNLDNFGVNSTENMLLSVAIGAALHSERIWKDLEQ